MNQAQRWKVFLQVWRTVRAKDFESSGDLVQYLDQEIEKIKKGKI